MRRSATTPQTVPSKLLLVEAKEGEQVLQRSSRSRWRASENGVAVLQVLACSAQNFDRQTRVHDANLVSSETLAGFSSRQLNDRCAVVVLEAYADNLQGQKARLCVEARQSLCVAAQLNLGQGHIWPEKPKLQRFPL
jgi:hypothetical protein